MWITCVCTYTCIRVRGRACVPKCVRINSIDIFDRDDTHALTYESVGNLLFFARKKKIKTFFARTCSFLKLITLNRVCEGECVDVCHTSV